MTIDDGLVSVATDDNLQLIFITTPNSHAEVPYNSLGTIQKYLSLVSDDLIRRKQILSVDQCNAK